jgi:hypothetical protein
MRTFLLAALVAIATPALAIAAPPDQIKLAQGRVDGAAKIYAGLLARWQSGQGTIDEVAGWSVRWLGAQRDQGLRGKPLKKALEDHRDRMKAVEASARDRVKAGAAPVIELEQATYFLAEAELWLARGK